VGTAEAYKVANQGAAGLISSARAEFAQERQHIAERNKPKIFVRLKRRSFLLKKRSGLIQRIEPLLNQSDTTTRTSLLNLVGVLCFGVVGFLLSRKTVEPFHLGAVGDVFSVGLSLFLPFALDRLMRRLALQKYVGLTLDFILFLTAISTMVAFAGVRADIFKHDIIGGAPVVFDALAESLPVADTSPDQVADLLRWAWISAALGFELATGLCLYDLAESRRGSNIGLLNKLEKALLVVEKDLLSVETEIQELLSEPSETYAKCWAHFRKGSKFARVVVIVIAGITAANGLAAAELHVIGALDLSGTEKVFGFEGRSQFEQNRSAVAQLLANLPVGARVNLIGITDKTFSNPLLLLGATLSDDAGYFGNRLLKGRQALLGEWSRRTSTLKPLAAHTDILGAFQYASEVFSHSEAKRKVLIFFSDMRNEQPGVLDLEKPAVINVAKDIENLEKRGLIAALPGVQVYAFSVGDPSGQRPPEYLVSLRVFWAEYIRRSGGELKVFSTTRDVQRAMSPSQ